MNAYWWTLPLLFIGTLATAEMPGMPGTPMGMPTGMPGTPSGVPVGLPGTPAGMPYPCGLGLPIGQPAVRTETNLGGGVRQIVFESYYFEGNQIVHRIQTGKITELNRIQLPQSPGAPAICQRGQEVLTKEKKRAIPSMGNCVWSGWTEKVLGDTRTAVENRFRQRTYRYSLPEDWETTYSRRVSSNAVPGSTTERFSSDKYVEHRNGQLYNAGLTIREPGNTREVAYISILYVPECGWEKTVNGVNQVYVNNTNCNSFNGNWHAYNINLVNTRIGPLETDAACLQAVVDAANR